MVVQSVKVPTDGRTAFTISWLIWSTLEHYSNKVYLAIYAKNIVISIFALLKLHYMLECKRDTFTFSIYHVTIISIMFVKTYFVECWSHHTCSMSQRFSGLFIPSHHNPIHKNIIVEVFNKRISWYFWHFYINQFHWYSDFKMLMLFIENKTIFFRLIKSFLLYTFRKIDRVFLIYNINLDLHKKMF